MEAIRFKGNGADETISRVFTHVEGVAGPDYTLCGITLDGDEGTAGEYDKVNVVKITCPDCVGIVKMCRNIKI